MKKRRNFTPEQKAAIVLELIGGEGTQTEIAQKYNIHTNQLLRWKAQFIENSKAAFDKGPSKDANELKKVQQEKDELYKKVGQLTVEVDWLKKKSGIK